jgi:hypothetical protein
LVTSSTCLLANNSFQLPLAATTKAFAMVRHSGQDGGCRILDFRLLSVTVATVDWVRVLISPGFPSTLG